MFLYWFNVGYKDRKPCWYFHNENNECISLAPNCNRGNYIKATWFSRLELVPSNFHFTQFRNMGQNLLDQCPKVQTRILKINTSSMVSLAGAWHEPIYQYMQISWQIILILRRQKYKEQNKWSKGYCAKQDNKTHAWGSPFGGLIV